MMLDKPANSTSLLILLCFYVLACGVVYLFIFGSLLMNRIIYGGGRMGSLF